MMTKKGHSSVLRAWLQSLQGDPSAVPQIVDNIKALLGQKPMFGICMGHQILGQVSAAASGQRGDDRHCEQALLQPKYSVQQDWPFSMMFRFDTRPQVVGGTTFKLKFGHHGGNHPIRHNKDGGLPCCSFEMQSDKRML
jgi:carbamoyl-phosphate synthase small subunit